MIQPVATTVATGLHERLHLVFRELDLAW